MTPQPLHSGPVSPLGSTGACGFPPACISQGNVLARGLTVVGGERGREGKKISTLVFSSWKIVVICSAFHLLRMEKKVEKFGEINLSTIVGTLALLSLPLFRATFLPGSLFPLLGTGADLGCSCSEAALGWAGRRSFLRGLGKPL